MECSHRRLEIVEIPVDQLDANAWNVNRMPVEMLEKLSGYIEREGLAEPIVVRRKGERFEILGGYHRWVICSERLGYKTMPCVVVDVDERRAKILSINLNEMAGQSVPTLLANLLHDLNRESELADLERVLPYQRAEMEDLLQLLRLPEGLESRLEEEAKRQDEEMPVIVSIALSRGQLASLEKALDRAKAEVGEGMGFRGRALERMAHAYLDAAPPRAVSAPGDSPAAASPTEISPSETAR